MIFLLAVCFSIYLNNRFSKGTVVGVTGNSSKSIDIVVEKGISNRGECVPLLSGTEQKLCLATMLTHIV